MKHNIAIAKAVGLILLTVLFLAGCWTNLGTNQDDPIPPSTPSPDQHTTIPGDGSTVSGDKKTDYIFTPDSTAIWRFDIDQGGEGGITFEVFDPAGNRIGHSQSALNWIYMQAGISYKISMDVWTYSVGIKNSYTITISQAETIPGEGGETQVDSESRYMLIPDQSGFWTFSTYVNSGDGEPFIWVWDIIAEEIVGDNFEGAIYHDALTLELVAGTVYSVSASFWTYGAGNYTLVVSPASRDEAPANT